jgi:hypothetical protein
MKALVSAVAIVVGAWMAAPGVSVSSNLLAAHATRATAADVTAIRFSQDMRKLWSDHVIWTREYIVAALDGHAGATAAAARLMRNQEEIGAAVKPFYGDAAGRRLTELLKEHISVAVDLVAAAKAGDKAGYAKADAAWQQNAIDTAQFLSGANGHWPQATLVQMMNEHLATTTVMVVARLNRNWDEDARAFDRVYEHILHMADALAAGIIDQFPDKFAKASATSSLH